ncbi:hypothetical protein K435DRAFT_479096 [Dendrothele bispora CBS 962.96]|uniref:Uncharacterized protein n=1 Tax=Dendrothele bispora (strain CBS 962.96) TaxID=1314807 RepID=A0A4S8MUS6_DENBC|nr:hypothetical protein K435DRAFT_479096 [Dendrothele bispora CBS 962.96]
MDLKNVTFNNTAQHLKYSDKWNLHGNWRGSDGRSGGLSSSNDPNASVIFTFPAPANAFYYYGIKRSNGGLYAICIDCDPNESLGPTKQDVDALDPNDKGDSDPVLLFSYRFNDFGIHNITLRNQYDSRGKPSGNSQITLAMFAIQVQDDSTYSYSLSTPSSSLSTSSPSSARSIPGFQAQGDSTYPRSTSSPSPLSTPSTSPPLSARSIPVGAIVGGAVAATIVLFLGALLFIHHRRIRAKQNRILIPAPSKHNHDPHPSFGYIPSTPITGGEDRLPPPPRHEERETTTNVVSPPAKHKRHKRRINPSIEYGYGTNGQKRKFRGLIEFIGQQMLRVTRLGYQHIKSEKINMLAAETLNDTMFAVFVSFGLVVSFSGYTDEK